jgi:hypothetical protein
MEQNWAGGQLRYLQQINENSMSQENHNGFMKSKKLQNEFLPFPPTGMTDVQKDSLIDIFRMLHPYVMADLKDEVQKN